MESTSIYWMPVWRVLENYASLKLVNPYFIKQLPGKKSDVKDAEWIATCLLKDLIKGSYIPEDLIQQFRQYDRHISTLNAECVRKLGKVDAALKRCNIRISNYVSTTDGKSYKEVVRLISEGIRDPAELAKVIHGRIVNRVGKGVVLASLTGVISDTDIDVIRQLILYAQLVYQRIELPVNVSADDDILGFGECICMESIHQWFRLFQ